jgi:hypothetical protein
MTAPGASVEVGVADVPRCEAFMAIAPTFIATRRSRRKNKRG